MKKDKDKRIQKPGKEETSIVRSSAAEYLTFVAASGKGGVEAVYADENIWLTQKMMGVLYDTVLCLANNILKSNCSGWSLPIWTLRKIWPCGRSR